MNCSRTDLLPSAMGSHGYWGIRARFYNSGGTEIGAQEALLDDVTGLSSTWAERGGVATAPAARRRCAWSSSTN